MAIHVTFWCHSRTLPASTSFWFRFHTSFSVIRFMSMWLIRGVTFAVMEHFILTQLSFPSTHYFFPTTEYEYCHPTRFPFIWLQGFFLVVTSVKKPQEVNQVNFQKLSSIVLLYMFRWYWLKSHAVTFERNSLTCVTSWAFIAGKERVSFILICFFF